MKKSQKNNLVRSSKRSSRATAKAFAFLAVILLGGAQTSWGKTYTGNAAVKCNPNDPNERVGDERNWNDPRNWGPVCLPQSPAQSGDSVEIPSGFGLTAPAGYSFSAISVAGSLAIQANQAPASVNVSGTLSVGSGPAYTITTPSMTVSGSLAVNTIIVPGGVMNWSSGSVSRDYTNDNPVALRIDPGAVLNLLSGNEKVLNNHSHLVNKGTVVHVAGNFAIEDNENVPVVATVVNDGTWAMEPGATVTSSRDRRHFFNNGTFVRPEGGGRSTMVLIFHNKGTLDIKSGELSIGNTLLIEDGSILTGAGKVVVDASRCNIAGTLTIKGQAALALSTTGTASGVVSAGGSESFPDGTIKTLENGAFEWTGGAINGTLNIAPSSRMKIFGPNDKQLGRGVLKNNGTITWTGTGNIQRGEFGKLLNLESGLFQIETDADLVADSLARGNGTIENRGTLRKVAGSAAGPTKIVLGNFQNYGVMDVQAGAFQVDGAMGSYPEATYGGAGQFVCAGGASVAGDLRILDGGTFELAGGGLGFTEDAKGVPTGKLITEGTGKFLWTGGGVGGKFTIPRESTVTISGDADKAIFTRSLFTNEGTINWSGKGALVLHGINGDGPLFDNRGTFNVLTDAVLAAGTYGRGTLANHGTINIGGGVNPEYGKFNLDWTIFLLERDGVVNMDVAAPVAGQGFDQINRTGFMYGNMNGTLNVRVPAGFSPSPGDAFNVVNGVGGQFATILGPPNQDFRGDYANGGLTLVATSLIRLTNGGATITITEGSPVQLSVELDSAVKQVTYFENGRQIQRKSAAPFGLDYSGLGAGVHVISAVGRTASGSEGIEEIRVIVDPIGGKTYRFTGASGDWLNPGNWSPTGVPGSTDSAIIDGKTVFASTAVTVRALSMEGATLSGPGEVTVTENGLLLSGLLSKLSLAIAETGKFSAMGEGLKTLNEVVLLNLGSMLMTGVGTESDLASTLTNQGEFIIDSLHFALANAQSGASARETSGGAATDGFWDWLFPPKPTKVKIGKVTNKGKVKIKGTLATGSFAQKSGNLQLGGLRIVPLIGQDGASLIGQDGGSLISEAGSGITAPKGTAFDDSGGPTSETQAAANFLIIDGGTISGYGRIGGDVVNRGGFMSPGGSPGMIEIDGNYTQGSAGTMLLEIGGTNTANLNFDKLVVSGNASLGGDLILRTVNNYTPNGTAVVPLSYTSVTGQFASVTANGATTFGASGMSTVVSGANPPAPKALNISTRMRVETGDNVLIAGFIVTGSQPKKVIIRGIGPSLPVSGSLADPILDLDNGTITNDDWRATQEQEINASGIPPASDRESAIVAILQPGPHTAILRGKNNGTGVGLVEVYDLEAASPAQLANISTRGQVQTGDDVMIGGFIVAGDYPARVLIRAIGPSLPVTGKLLDPVLELVDAQGNILNNDNWRATQELEINATTVPPTNDNESAIVATLVPGAYTAVVRGKNGTTGVALVEGYNLQ